MTDFVQQFVKLVERDFGTLACPKDSALACPTPSNDQPPSNDQQARLDEQRALIDEQRGLIDEQRACLVQHQREIEKLQTLILKITAIVVKQSERLEGCFERLRETPDRETSGRETSGRETANKKRKMNDDTFDIAPEESELLDSLFNDI